MNEQMNPAYAHEQLGNYRLVRLLGRGGFASIYLGKHCYLNTKAAIKVLYSRPTYEQARCFHIEAQYLTHMRHPHIVPVLDFGVKDGMPFLVMAFLKATRWHLVCDHLNTHQSASLVRWVADLSGVQEDLGVKDESGILASMASRVAFLSDPSHKVVVHSTPKQSSWLNQMEIWLSILVRKLLTRGSFTSVEELQARVLAFIEYDNQTMAKPFKWTY
jgi:hypothetical protein